MADCIFCKIVAGEIPSEIVFKDDRVTAFRDIHPVAPTHILIVPNKHIASINELQPEDEGLMGYLFTVERKLAEQEGIAQSGFRSIINTGPDSGQEVHHLHLHLIGGQRMRHPMG
ncbi:MAG: histidine triad nucleotide-binding protein [Chloroflexi bacterium]|jgi:histidine triad (HIT) family protein|nr:histidine triad nucleotide-binding protein [Chloroflexota bacterium]